VKRASIRELKQKLSTRFLDSLNGDVCTITTHGRVCGVITQMTDGSDELLEYLLARDQKFIELVRKSDKSGRVSSAEIERGLADRERSEARKKRRRAA